MTTIGVDPGLGGALATYNKLTGTLDVCRMPTMLIAAGRKKRTRLDIVGLMNYLELQQIMGADQLVLEAVFGRPAGSTNGAFVFGYTVGVVMGCAISLRIPLESVSSHTWKRMLHVPGKATAQPGDIISRADQLLPEHVDLWRGPKGGLNVDVAEAAMIAYFGEHYVLGSDRPTDIKDTEFRMVYGGHRRAGT